MDIGNKLGETALDLIKNENMQNKSTDLLSMIFPYAGIEKKAVDMYIDEIEKSDLPLDTKMIAVLNARTTLKKLKNQSKIIQIADMDINQNNSTVDPSKVNEEWIDRFMDSAGYVSSEEMQLIWGKILANEIETPGSTPPNMIRILSEITPNLARAFRKLCSMKVIFCPLTDDENVESAFQRIIVPYSGHDEKFREMGISFNILNELETLGIIKLSTISGYITKGIENSKVLTYVDNRLEVISGHRNGEIPIGNVLLTAVGDALQKITEDEDIPDYYEMIRSYMEEKDIIFDNEHDFQLVVHNEGVRIEKKTSEL